VLKPIGKVKHVRAAAGARFAIVASKYNARYVDSMLRGAERVLRAAGAEQTIVVRVPGAFEIPVVAAKLASRHSPRFAAIICLGVILRGETTHAQHIGESVSQSLAQIQVQSGIPIIHEVLLLETEEQAKARCLSREHNRGDEAARTALEMHRVMLGLDGES
jgi:6,7-dimethyl-8-ribityllumazine synthase